MKELKEHSGIDWSTWFWVDKEEFPDAQKSVLCRYRVKKAVGRDSAGDLILMEWINHDQCDWHKFTQNFYALDTEEYVILLDRAIAQGEVKPEERKRLIEKANAPFLPPWDIQKTLTVFQDTYYTLGQENGFPYLTAAGKRYILTCHPYEPCLYITDESGSMTTVHNAFEPFDVLAAFYRGNTITSITGMKYSAEDFCRMVEYAAGKVNIRIDEAEKVFGDRTKRKAVQKEETNCGRFAESGTLPAGSACIPEEDPFYDLIAAYPDIVVDYCIVKNDLPYCGYESHDRALKLACGKLFADTQEEDLSWQYDVGKAKGKRTDTDEQFASTPKSGDLNYRKAFLYPPHRNAYTGVDFVKVNSVLFPNGTDALEIYAWSTDWSDYFDEGHEWWGALCLTVYDRSLDRFAVILASATD